MENHKCGINHQGSADAIEKDSADKIFCRLVEKHNLRYTVYIDDGDTSSFGEVKEALYNKFRMTILLKTRTALVRYRKE